MVVNLSGIQPQGPKHLETLENKTVDGTQNTVRVNRGTSANRPQNPVVGEFYYNTDKQAFEQYTSSGWFNIAQAPGAPTSLVATDQGAGRSFNNGQASVAFTASTSGGAPSSFIVTPSPATSPATFTGTSSPITVTGLSSSTQYTYTATAVGTYGTSSASTASAGVTATTVPQAPTIGTATGTTDGSGTATVTFTAGSTGGSAITSFTATSSPGSLTASSASSPITISGLTLDTAYTFTTTATNSNGISLSSLPSNSITPTLALNSYESIATVTVGSGGATSIDFNSIPSTYKHLQLRGIYKQAGTGDTDWMNMTINGSSLGWRHLFWGTGGPGIGAYSDSASQFIRLWMQNSGSVFSSFILDIYDYANANKQKTLKAVSGFSSSNTYGSIALSSNRYPSNTPITSLSFINNNGNFQQYSSISLYGIKG